MGSVRKCERFCVAKVPGFINFYDTAKVCGRRLACAKLTVAGRCVPAERESLLFRTIAEARGFAEWEALVLRYAPYGATDARVDRVAVAAEWFLNCASGVPTVA